MRMARRLRRHKVGNVEMAFVTLCFRTERCGSLQAVGCPARPADLAPDFWTDDLPMRSTRTDAIEHLVQYFFVCDVSMCAFRNISNMAIGPGLWVETVS